MKRQKEQKRKEEPPESFVREPSAPSFAEIDAAYAVLREVSQRASQGEQLDEEINRAFLRLRELQEQQAEAMLAGFRWELEPGEGWKALARAREILGDDESLARNDESGS